MSIESSAKTRKKKKKKNCRLSHFSSSFSRPLPVVLKKKMTSHRRRWPLLQRFSSSTTTTMTTRAETTTTSLDPLDENEEGELWEPRRLGPPLPLSSARGEEQPPSPTAIADLCHHPSASLSSRRRLKPPSLSSCSTYRSDYKPCPVTPLEGSKAQSFGLGNERGRSERGAPF